MTGTTVIQYFLILLYFSLFGFNIFLCGDQFLFLCFYYAWNDNNSNYYFQSPRHLLAQEYRFQNRPDRFRFSSLLLRHCCRKFYADTIRPYFLWCFFFQSAGDDFGSSSKGLLIARRPGDLSYKGWNDMKILLCLYFSEHRRQLGHWHLLWLLQRWVTAPSKWYSTPPNVCVKSWTMWGKQM